MARKFKTALTEMVGIDNPIVCAGMGRVTYGRLAGAVSSAGGLGVIGGIDCTPDQLREEIKIARSITDKPIGVDLGFPERAPASKASVELPPAPEPVRELLAEIKEQGVEVGDSTDQAISKADNTEKLEIALEAGVEVVVSALGTPAWVAERCHEKGATLFSLVGNARNAEKAIAAGTDVIIASGVEAGGHVGRIGLLTLIPEIREMTDKPILGAGGIVNGGQIAAVLVAGGAGVWVGTRFLATQESSAKEIHKQAVIESGFDQTLRTTLFDGLAVRMLQNRFTGVWKGRENEILPYPQQRLFMAPIWHATSDAGLKDYTMLGAGQGSGLIKDLPKAADLVEQLAEETWQALYRGTDILY